MELGIGGRVGVDQLMGVDLLAVLGEAGPEPPVGQHCFQLDVES
jgi:hypothetical protein